MNSRPACLQEFYLSEKRLSDIHINVHLWGRIHTWVFQASVGILNGVLLCGQNKLLGSCFFFFICQAAVQVPACKKTLPLSFSEFVNVSLSRLQQDMQAAWRFTFVFIIKAQQQSELSCFFFFLCFYLFIYFISNRIVTLHLWDIHSCHTKITERHKKIEIVNTFWLLYECLVSILFRMFFGT